MISIIFKVCTTSKFNVILKPETHGHLYRNVFSGSYDIFGEKIYWNLSEKSWIPIISLLLKLAVGLGLPAWLWQKEAHQILLKFDDKIQCENEYLV